MAPAGLVARISLIGCCILAMGAAAEVKRAAAPRSRTFLFTYSAIVTGLQHGQAARIWLPVPSSSTDQDVRILSQDLPADPRMGHETENGNRLAYVQARSGAEGRIPLSIVYRVTRHEVGEAAADPASESDSKYLRGDALVPIGGKPMELLANRSLPHDRMALARVMYDVVDDHLEYRKDKPGWGRGDAVWACESGFGNCTDFHSLFISLARSEGIPSAFEIGFAIPEERGKGVVAGYHCWAKFKPAGHGWVPVDISEARLNPRKRDYYFGHLSEDRVAFSTGRDLVLTPRQAGPPVNFLVYPYVEVDGKPYPAEKIERHFSYEDVRPGK